MSNVVAKLRYRMDAAANWAASNPVLLPGEPGFEADTLLFKVGDGATPWNSLAYRFAVPPGVSLDINGGTAAS